MTAMTFEIVQQKDGINHAIKVTDAETIIGRGKLLEITDKRVSRKHALLLLAERELKLQSTHVNPCFLKLKRYDKKMLLKQGESITLFNGDEFSLLQDNYNFQVICKHEDQSLENVDLNEQKSETHCNDINGDVSKFVSTMPNHDVEAAISKESSSNEFTDNKLLKTNPKKLTKVKCQLVKSSIFPVTDFSNTDEACNRKRKLPEWMLKNKVKKQCVEEVQSPSPNSITACVTAVEVNSVKNSPQQDLEILKAEATISPDINLTADSPKSEQQIVDSTSTSIAVKDDVNIGSCNVNVSSREKCAYGASCYRKNPIHFQEYSHPGDTDYYQSSSSDEDDDKPECEFGLQCYRKNPLHRKQYKHSRRILPSRSTAKSNKDDLNEDDDYESSFIDDDDDDDDVTLSEDSDWEPSQSVNKNKQRKSSDSSSDDDIDELVSNAKDFIKNKNLWKK